MSSVLMVVTAADSLTLADGDSHPTGFWAEEVATSHRILREAGLDVRIATPGGRPAPVDPISLDERGGVAAEDARDLSAYLDSISAELSRPLVLADARVADYDAVYLPGGHGPMADLATDPDLARILAEADARRLTVAALCHGPAGLLGAVGADGRFLFAGRRLTVFTDDEERQGGLGDRTPYLVESRLRELGAVIASGPAWSSTVVSDGNLITGQNPQSSADTAREVVKAVSESRTR
ncbi:type 1 glutamine amidotransferase domain-containing protein [Amorphoplanes digitatis]|uniref:Putative intracellular protease/amidase n=1 Tax=Actinoplanes digitatis TaxID=1868 RepID=A0A7W7I3G0_9ACTN|nr:type 1 glutamine amidotransferase domain-containing protein [Actinoplanes digitatis]MBB4765745.1 putative intracellular protease/amidase [Actinoplanes digitatis]GID93463.1 dimethylallyltransferase [Actinoplanes digitatis]